MQTNHRPKKNQSIQRVETSNEEINSEVFKKSNCEPFDAIELLLAFHRFVPFWGPFHEQVENPQKTMAGRFFSHQG